MRLRRLLGGHGSCENSKKDDETTMSRYRGKCYGKPPILLTGKWSGQVVGISLKLEKKVNLTRIETEKLIAEMVGFLNQPPLVW